MYCIAVARDGTINIEFDLKNVAFYKRNTHKEILNFFVQEVLLKCADSESFGKMNQFKHPELPYNFFVYNISVDVGAVLVTHTEFKSRLACETLKRAFDCKNLMELLKNPEACDPICRLEKEIEQTRVTLEQTLEKLAQRGIMIDDLVNKTELLSSQTKTFYKKAKNTNVSYCWFI